MILVLEELVILIVKCITYIIKYRSDYRVIEIMFDVATPERVNEARLLFKNALWNNIKARIATSFYKIPFRGTI